MTNRCQTLKNKSCATRVCIFSTKQKKKGTKFNQNVAFIIFFIHCFVIYRIFQFDQRDEEGVPQSAFRPRTGTDNLKLSLHFVLFLFYFFRYDRKLYTIPSDGEFQQRAQKKEK